METREEQGFPNQKQFYRMYRIKPWILNIMGFFLTVFLGRIIVIILSHSYNLFVKLGLDPFVLVNYYPIVRLMLNEWFIYSLIVFFVYRLYLRKKSISDEWKIVPGLEDTISIRAMVWLVRDYCIQIFIILALVFRQTQVLFSSTNSKDSFWITVKGETLFRFLSEGFYFFTLFLNYLSHMILPVIILIITRKLKITLPIVVIILLINKKTGDWYFTSSAVMSALKGGVPHRFLVYYKLYLTYFFENIFLFTTVIILLIYCYRNRQWFRNRFFDYFVADSLRLESEVSHEKS